MLAPREHKFLCGRASATWAQISFSPLTLSIKLNHEIEYCFQLSDQSPNQEKSSDYKGEGDKEPNMKYIQNTCCRIQ